MKGTLSSGLRHRLISRLSPNLNRTRFPRCYGTSDTADGTVAAGSHSWQAMNILDKIRRMRAPNDIERQLFPPPQIAIRIRAYERRDRDSALELYDLNAPDRFPDGHRKIFEEFLDTEPKSYFIVETSEQIPVACGGVELLGANSHLLGYGLVSPRFQNLRIGSTLTLARLVFATRTSGTQASLIAAVPKSMGFYRRFGYEETNRWTGPDSKEYPMGLLAFDSLVMKPIEAVLRARGHLIDPTLQVHANKTTTAIVTPVEGGGVQIALEAKNGDPEGDNHRS